MTDQVRRVAPDNIQLQRLEVEQVSVSQLNPNSYNANRMTESDFELLLKSMQDDGFTQPVIAIRRNKEIVDGEHRWRAAQALGMTTIPVVWVDMTPEQQRISTLRHNRARGSEDMNLAAELLRDLQARGATDFVLDGLNMAPEELEFLLKDVNPPEVLESPEVRAATEADPDDRAGIADATRQAESRIGAQKQAEKVAMAEEDRDIYRLSFSFMTDELKFVQRVLGPEPAKRVVEMCKAELARDRVAASV